MSETIQTASESGTPSGRTLPDHAPVAPGAAVRDSDAGPRALDALRSADPVLARVIDAHPDYHPRAWIDELPGHDAFSTLVFQVAGQQLSVRATRTILSRLEQSFGGHLPSPAELLAADPNLVRASGLSARKSTTIRAIAERFADGRFSDEAFAAMSDEEVEAALTQVSGIGPWTARGFLLIALDRPDVLITGDLALRHNVQDLYGLDQLPSEEELMNIAERWRPYRSLAVSYLLASEFGGRS